MPQPIDWTTEQRKAFSKLFYDARKRMGLSQIDAASGAGIDKGFIVSVETGPYAGMRVADLFRAARFFGIRLDDIAASLGYGLDTSKSEYLAPYENAVAALSDSDRDTLLRTLDATLRGMQRR